MKQGRTLADFAEEVKRQAETKEDYVVDTRALTMQDNCDIHIEGVGRYDLTNRAHRQLGYRLGIPHKYYKRMMEEAPDLLARNANHWFLEKPETRMVRMLDGNIRAILSDRYRTLDNIDLAEAVLPAMGEAGMEVASCEVSPDFLHIKGISPREPVEIGPPEGFEWGKGHARVDVVQPGLVIRNSEVGAGSLQVLPAVHTVHCSNLAIFGKDGIRRFHLGEKLKGSSTGRAWRYLSDETKALTDAAIWGQVKDLIKASLEGQVFDDIVNELRDSRGHYIGVKPTLVIERLSDTEQLTKDEGDSVLEHLMAGGDLTKYGLHAAVTRAAEDLESYDRATDLEQLGSKVVRMKGHDWERFAIVV